MLRLSFIALHLQHRAQVVPCLTVSLIRAYSQTQQIFSLFEGVNFICRARLHCGLPITVFLC